MEFQGASLFRHHLVCSLLTQRRIVLSGIHSRSEAALAAGATEEELEEGAPVVPGGPVGIRDFEANFLKFLDRVSSGSQMSVSDSNTRLSFSPGLILGGTFSHAVPPSRCVSYIIEAALLLLPFAKYPSEITFTGATQHDDDLSVDTIRTVTKRWMSMFGVECDLRIVRRGVAPNADGCVILSVGNVRRLRAVTATDRGRVRRVRGIAFSCRASADLAKRCATSAKGVLLGFLPDVYVVTDVNNGRQGIPGLSSGYGVVLVAETTSKHCVIAQETIAALREEAEEVGLRASRLLLDQIADGGCVDGPHQAMVLLLMAASPDDISSVRFGTLTEGAVSAMMMMERYFGVTCAVKSEEQRGDGLLPATSVVTCMGANLVNVSKKSG